MVSALAVHSGAPADAAAQPPPTEASPVAVGGGGDATASEASPSPAITTPTSSFPPLWYAGIVTTTLAVSGYVVGGVLSSVFANQWEAGEGLCDYSAPPGCFDEQDAALERASRTAVGASVSFVLSGAVLGAAIAMFVGGIPNDRAGAEPTPSTGPAAPPRVCGDDSQCGAEEQCDDGACGPRTDSRDSGLVAGGIVCMSLGLASAVPAVSLVFASLDFGGSSPGSPDKRIGAGVLGGVSLGLLVAGATMVGVGAEQVAVRSASNGAARSVELSPLVGPGFLGLAGRF